MNNFLQRVMQGFVIVLLFQSYIHAQSIGEWRVYSSFSTVSSISTNIDGQYFVTTQGGLYIVDDNLIVDRYTTIDGMHRLDGIKSIYDNRNNRLIIGYSDGVVDLFDPTTNSFEKVNDIERVSEFTSKSINDIEIIGDNVFFATDFGIVTFDRDQFFVTNSYLNLGDFPRGTAVNDLTLLSDSIFAATTQGIASGSIQSNLVDVNNWYNRNLNNSMNSEVKVIQATTSEVYAISNDSLYFWERGKWDIFQNQPLFNPIGLVSTGQNILISNSDRVINISSEGVSSLVYQPETTNITTIQTIDNRLLVGTRENGLVEIGPTESVFNPSGPYLNFFSELIFKDGILLASASDQFPQTDPFNPIRGYYVFNESKWNNYNQNTNEVLQNFRFARAFTVDMTTENYIIGSWGEGIAIHSRETNEISVFDNSNSGLSGISANREYVVVSGIDSDSKENTWAISFISNLPLNVYSNESKEWTNFPSLPINNDELYFRIFVDSKDKLWIPLIDISNNGKGILVIDPGQDPFDDNDDTFRKLTSNENSGNLPEDNVIAISEDKNGEIWIGTTRGIARFIFPDFIVSSNNQSEISAQWLINADTSATSRFLLRDINVSSIAVNSANQKWIGSANQGLWLLNEDGSEILARYTSENSPLISDNIQDIAINDETGEVFISTDLGLVSIIETATSATNKLEELKVYPNPFVYSKHEHMVIEDLSDESVIRIIGSDGSVFTSFEARGGRVIWNGLDDYGNRLASGVYFVVALNEDGAEKRIGKVVIIR